MTFPPIQFKATNTELDDRLTTLVEQKFETLAKFIGDETDVRCEVEFDKETAHHSGRHYRVEVNLWVKGKLYRVGAAEESFEQSIDEVRSELDKMLRRSQGKHEALVKKGSRVIKQMMRGEV